MTARQSRKRRRLVQEIAAPGDHRLLRHTALSDEPSQDAKLTVGMELEADVLDMIADGMKGNRERVADFLITGAFAQQLQDLNFPHVETIQRLIMGEVRLAGLLGFFEFHFYEEARLVGGLVHQKGAFELIALIA